MHLKRMVEQSDTRAGRWFDAVVFALIVVSLITFSIETLPNLPPPAAAMLYWIEFATVLLFTGEYLLRLAVADSAGGLSAASSACSTSSQSCRFIWPRASISVPCEHSGYCGCFGS